MAVPIITVVYQEFKQGGGGNIYDVSDIITFAAQEGLSGATNNLQCTLKNPFNKYTSGAGNLTRFQEGDTITVYADYDPIDTTSTNKLIKAYTVRKISTQVESTRTLSLELVDNTYLLLSGLWSQAYDFKTSGINAPQTIINVVKNRVVNNVGNYNITAALTTDGGHVQAYAPTAYSDGSAETGTLESSTSADYFGNWRCELSHAFYSAGTPTGTGACGSPDCTATNYYPILYSPLFKTVYDIIRELSQVQYTRWDAQKTFVFYVDKDGQLHWYYPSDTANSNTIEEGNKDTKMIDLSESTFEAYNMVIFNAGKDKNGNGILGYHFNPNVGTGVPKMKYIPMLECAIQLKAQLTADGTYSGMANGDFRKQCVNIGKGKANDLINKYGRPRLKGSIRLRGTHNYHAGDLINVTSPSMDLINRKLRVIDLQHTINSNDWQTTLVVEEDDYAILDIRAVV